MQVALRHSLALPLISITCAAQVFAQTEAPSDVPAPAPAPAPAAVWYRSGEGCPDGAAFLELLRRRETPAQLAQVGDRIDFVVTLGSGPDGSRGQLERQAEQGTVALREVQGKTCDAVADALALSLALTWDPSQRGAPEAPPVSAPAQPAPRADAPSPVRVAAPVPAHAVARTPEPPPRTIWLGIEGSLWSLSEAVPFFGGAVFGEVRSSRSGTGFRPLVRLSAELLFSPDLGGEVEGWIGAGRIEGCPVSFGTALLKLRPCTGFDLGLLRAAGTRSGGASASDFWAAWSTQARLSWETGSNWGLDAQVGIIVPLTHYELVVGKPEQTVSELRRLVFAAGIGAHWGPP